MTRPKYPGTLVTSIERQMFEDHWFNSRIISHPVSNIGRTYNDNKDIFALVASSGGMIHANDSAYVMSTVGGSATRVNNNGGDIRAPHLWQEGPNPPNITSVTGSDMAVITDTGDGQPHLTIYGASCASGWYDTALGQCTP